MIFDVFNIAFGIPSNIFSDPCIHAFKVYSTLSILFAALD